MTVQPAAIDLRTVTKTFPGGVKAVDNVSLAISEGEFFSLLGPSGCGKTTTLRMIAGFDEPTSGCIVLRGEECAGRPPNRRNVNTVFQHYALFPHMNVHDNVMFGLKLERVDRGERAQRVREMLDLVGLEGLDGRRPGELSGGQQQRVALARALVKRPAALLLDEPLGALDMKLRKRMQSELKRIQRELNTTFVYVTHDQDEALSMSDRLAVMQDGRVEQVDSPQAVYERPATAFVADFIGSANLFSLEVESVANGIAECAISGTGRIRVRAPQAARAQMLPILVRPERVRIIEDDSDSFATRVEGRVTETVYLGGIMRLIVSVEGLGELDCHHDPFAAGEPPAIGDRVALGWDINSSVVLEAAAEGSNGAVANDGSSSMAFDESRGALADRMYPPTEERL